MKNLKINIKLPHSALELNQINIIDKQPDIIKTQTVYDLKEKELKDKINLYIDLILNQEIR